MTLDHPDNPSTSFDGIAREPSNAEMAANWRVFVAYSFLGLVFLWIEWAILYQDWALPWLNHGSVVWLLVAFVTWRRPIIHAALTVLLALLVGAKAFALAFASELKAA